VQRLDRSTKLLVVAGASGSALLAWIVAMAAR